MHALYYWLALFAVLEFLGDLWPGYIANHYCLPLLGCNLGFFGYEGFMHFVSGVCVALGLVWAHERSYLPAPTARTMALWSAGIALAWELCEWIYDLVRIYALHMDLLNPNRLAQPNFIDTAGDVVLALAGTALAFAYMGYKKRRTE